MGAEARQKKTRIEAHGVTLLRDRLASGALDALALVESYIARIEAREPAVGRGRMAGAGERGRSCVRVACRAGASG